MTWRFRATDLSRVDLTRYLPLIPEAYQFFFDGDAGVAPYRLLAYLSTLVSNQSLVEIGVHNGWGSLALSYNPSNAVTGYDIDLSTLSPAINALPQMVFKQGLAHEMDPETILAAPFIHFDALHDGVYERVFFDFLARHGYEGLVMADDIHLNASMRAFWDSITQPKVDMTRWGHDTGTGLACFGDTQFVFDE